MENTSNAKKTLAQRIAEQTPDSIYISTAKKFGVTYKYVWMIAKGERSASRSKGKLIKEYLEEQFLK